MKPILTLLILLSSLPAFSIGCFEQHMRSAIKRNENRKSFYSNPKYSDQVRKRAKFIANSLILGEKFSLSIARDFDEKAKFFHEQGLTIVCDEMVDINDIRDPVVFSEPTGSQPTKFISSGGHAIAVKLRAALKEDNLNEVITIAQSKLNELATRPDYNCLMRNDLRTILFIAQRAPFHEKKAAELGIESPRELSKALIKKMASALYMIDFYDKKAFPIQKQGIAIICQDFPGARGSL